MSEEILYVGVEQEDNRGYYNVWKYDEKTSCIAWGIKADNSRDAINKAIRQEPQ